VVAALLRFKRRFVPVIAASAVVACNAILGIDDAHVDPRTVESLSCANYCASIMTRCTGVQAEYTSKDVCEAMCSQLDPGRLGEKQNDSLACRLTYLKQAESNPSLYCPQAGPLGSGPCSTDVCASFCSLASALCTPRGQFPYDGEPACRGVCARVPYAKEGADAGRAGPVGDLVFASGNTLNCRLYHLQSAYEVGNAAAPLRHCPHIAAESSTCHD
jgi:hypothetical protein